MGKSSPQRSQGPSRLLTADEPRRRPPLIHKLSQGRPPASSRRRLFGLIKATFFSSPRTVLVKHILTDVQDDADVPNAVYGSSRQFRSDGESLPACVPK